MRKISPQGYNYTEEPLNNNPFWEGEEGGGDIPAGGTTGQVLGKASDEDYDVTWLTVGGGGVVVDDAFSVTSENPVQNKVITESVNNITDDINTLRNDVDDLGEYTALIKDNVDDIPNNYYNKTQTDNLLNNKADATALNNYRLISDSYSKTQTDNLLNNKADTTALNNYRTITDSYSKTEINTLLNDKVSDSELSQELQNYRTISDSYSKTEINSLLNNKANSSDLTALETNINTALNNKVDNLTYQTKINEIEDDIDDMQAGIAGIDAVLTINIGNTTYTYTPDGNDVTITFSAAEGQNF